MPKNHTSRILLFGFPVDSYEPDQLQEMLTSLHENYLTDLRPRFGTIINALVLSQASGWPFKTVAPDVGKLIRSSDYVGLDSPFLQKCALFLGNPVKMMSSDQLFEESILFAMKTGKKVYLLGGDTDTCKKTVEKLSKEYPQLKISGFSAPNISTKGLALEESVDNDAEIIESINKTKPDILLIQLGHPKQDLWFGRVANQLKVPLSLGVGGAFERYLGVARGQTGWSSIKRKASSTLRYLFWFPLLFLYNTINRILFDLIFKRMKEEKRRRLLFLSESDSISVIPFPAFVDRTTWSKKPDWLEEAMEHNQIVFDLSAVRHIDLAGLALLSGAAHEIEREGKTLFLLGISAELRSFLKMHGIWDYFAPFSLRSPADLINRLQKTAPYSEKLERDFVSIHQLPEETVLGIFGPLNCLEDGDFRTLNLDSIIEGKNCRVDLRYCGSISNKGFGFLLKLRSEQIDQGKKLTLTNVSRDLKAQFKNVKLKNAFHFG